MMTTNHCDKTITIEIHLIDCEGVVYECEMHFLSSEGSDLISDCCIVWHYAAIDTFSSMDVSVRIEETDGPFYVPNNLLAPVLMSREGYSMSNLCSWFPIRAEIRTVESLTSYS